MSKWVSAGDKESKQIEATARQYVNARLAFALAKGISMCVRGQREKWGRVQRDEGEKGEEEREEGRYYGQEEIADAAQARAAVQ